MKIIEVLKLSAELLGLNSERDILVSTTEENESTALENEKISKLFNLVKFSLQELCTNYIPVIEKTEITTTDKKFALGNLENYIRIFKVFDGEEAVKFKIINRNLTMEEDGTYMVEYYTYPTINSLFDEIDFLSNFSPDAVVFSLCAYYCLAVGLFDDFNEFHEKYLTVAENLKNIRIFSLPQRRWV